MRFPLSLSALLLSVLTASAVGPDGKFDFAHDVVPILKTHCVKCHANGTYKGGVSFDTRSALVKSKAVVPGKSGESELIKRVIHTEAEERMPPKAPPLSQKDIATLRTWIDGGLSWEEGFSFKPPTYVSPLRPRRPTLPPAVAGRDHPIDRIVDAYYAKNKVTPPAALDDTSFLRRIFMDLIGQMPTVEETDAFLKDPSSDKRAKLIRGLLSESRTYTEHWLSFWNDHLRNDYVGTGYIDGGRKQFTPWLYQSLLENKPYDQFVRELVAPPSRESEGFSHGIKWRGSVNASQVVELQFAQNVGQIFFGINLKCASCHDSFIDHWKLDDAYSLASVIADKPMAEFRCDKATGRVVGPRFLFPELGKIDPNAPKAKRLEQLAALVTHPENGRFTRTIANRIWNRLFGRGIVFPVDVMENRPWSEDLLDYLGVYLSDNGYDLKKLIEHIVSSRTYQSQAVPIPKEPLGEEYVFQGPEFQRLTAEEFLDAVWQITETAPATPAKSMTAKLPEHAERTPKARRNVRAALLISDPLMRSLGRPNREQVVTVRPDQLSTLQAIDLTNGSILTETLTRGAANLLKKDTKRSPEALIEHLFQLVLSRKPSAGEKAASMELVGEKPTQEGVADLLWSLVMLPEFQLVR